MVRRTWQTNVRFRIVPATARVRRGGFTLLEIAASLLVLAILLSGIWVAYHETRQAVAHSLLRDRAGAVAQRHMENLLATGQEPNSGNLNGEDEIDPFFEWRMSLSRVPLPGATISYNLNNYLIKAQVTARPIGARDATADEVQMIRYFVWLNPVPGESVPVPLTQEVVEEPWMIELRQKLGHEPTPEDIIDYLMKSGDLPSDVPTGDLPGENSPAGDASER
jgi:prepilin-type N-terminal cleavage/methylation domain-containing protein